MYLFYFLFFIGCLAGSCRDTLLELWGDKTQLFHPLFLLWCGCLVSQIVAAGVLVIQSIQKGHWRGFSVPRSAWSALIGLNIANALSFVTYALSLNSVLGSGLTTVLGFGVDAFLTAYLGQLFFRERIPSSFYLGMMIALFGMGVLNMAHSWQMDLYGWYWGFGLCLVSSIFFSLYVIFIKQMTLHQVPDIGIVFWRFVITNLGLGIWCVWKGLCIVPNLAAWMRLGVLSFFFTISVVTFIVCVRKVPVATVVVLLAMMPLMTCILNAWLGMRSFGWHEGVGIFFILSGALYFEWMRYRQNSNLVAKNS